MVFRVIEEFLSWFKPKPIPQGRFYTNEDILKMSDVAMEVKRTNKPVTITLSDGEAITYKNYIPVFDWSRCRT